MLGGDRGWSREMRLARTAGGENRWPDRSSLTGLETDASSEAAFEPR